MGEELKQEVKNIKRDEAATEGVSECESECGLNWREKTQIERSRRGDVGGEAGWRENVKACLECHLPPT